MLECEPEGCRHSTALFLALFLSLATFAWAQGPAPETAPPLFPKGALVSYGSDFIDREFQTFSATSRPTFSHQGNFVFTWGFYRNFDLTLSVPVVTNRFEDMNEVGGTGLGDMLIVTKYRFYRRDSPRGTNQASISGGVKLPSGNTGLKDPNGNLLPASLQPGSGSTDFFVGLNWTYTGLFNIKRLVADADFHSLLRTEGTQQTRLGNDAISRFWISYRPYESTDVKREWFIGPTITWLYSQDDQIGGIKQQGSGGNVLMLGATTYFGISPGTHVWLGLEWSVSHSHTGDFMPVQRHISIGITKQFRFI